MKLDIEKRAELIAALILLVMLVQLIYLIDYQSLTNDEFTNMAAGKYYVANQDFSPFVLKDHPLLGYLVSSFFLYFDDNSIWSRIPHDVFYIFGNNPYSIDYLLFITRLPVALTAILLGIYIFKWTKELYGKKAALLALLLYSFEPNILTHFSIATTDFVLTAFIFIAMYYLWKFDMNPTINASIIAGIAFGLAIISKHTALVLIPITFGFFLLLYKKNILKRNNLIKIFAYFIAAFLVFWAAYGFYISSIAETVHSEGKALEFINKTYNSEISRSVINTAINIPIPSPQYFTALGYRFWQKTTGHEYYFFGDIQKYGRPDYYIIMFIVKTPIPLLIFLGLFISFVFLRLRKIDWKNEKLIIGFILIYFILMTFFVGLNIGLRHMLPIFPFLFILASSLVNIKFKNKDNNVLFKIVIIILIVWYVIEAVSIFPHNLSYFNEIIGPENAWMYFADADIDWGQELKAFGNYVEKYNIDHVYIARTNFNMTNDLYLKNYSFAGCEPKNGIYGISVSQLTLFGNRDCYKWLKERKPDSMIGYSILIYNVTNTGREI